MIRDIIQNFSHETPPYSKTAAALANAVYFFDLWSWEFDPDKTKTDIFYAPQGETKASYMLLEGNSLYFEDEKPQALPLSFKAGGGFYILLPKDGDAAGLLESLTDDYFTAIRAGSAPARGKLLLPRFSIEEEAVRLENTLKTLDIPFNEMSLTGLLEKTGMVNLAEAVHKAAIKIDEKGTAATTATILTIVVTSPGDDPPQPKKTFNMNCNKPIVFVLYDRTRDEDAQVLFTGMVNQP
jgi:serine protease inhibitor